MFELEGNLGGAIEGFGAWVEGGDLPWGQSEGLTVGTGASRPTS
jgi:hypothetical protein